ncbi:glycosyltransferase [Flavobacteriaceae bacterium Ap0902]|nr:glycosyltransferase [Flavobacteriaceae bacterium Ap0902]
MSKRKPLVSICCLAYNHGPYIKQCIDGFLMQETNFEYEILIHEDASTDNTARIIREYQEKYPCRIKPIFQTENQYSKGIKPTLAYNFPRAQGKYIAMCEGDDYWTNPLKLQKQIDFLESNPQYNLSCCNYKVLDYDGKTILDEYEYKYVKNKECIKINEDIFLKHWLTKTMTVVFRNDEELILKFKELKNFRDISLFYTIIKNGQGIFQNFYCGIYRRSYNGVHSSHTAIQAENATLKIVKELYSIYKTDALFNKIETVKRNLIYYNFKHSKSKKVPFQKIRELKIPLKDKIILIIILFYNLIKIK